MPDITEVRPDVIGGDARLAKLKAERDNPRPSLLTGAGAAVAGWLPAEWRESIYLQTIPADPTFQENGLTREQLERFAPYMEPDDIPRLADARSMAEVYERVSLSAEHARNKRTLFDMGWRGKALGVVAGVTDPAYLFAAVASGGIGSLIRAGTVGRAAVLAARGLVTGGAFSALETTRKDAGVIDVAAAGLAGFGMTFGGGLVKGRVTGGLLAGAGAGLPPAFLEAVGNQFREKDQQRSAGLVLLNNFLLAGGLHMISAGPHESVTDHMDEGTSLAVDRVKRDIEFAAVKDAGGAATKLGEVYFKNQTPEAQANRTEAVLEPVRTELDHLQDQAPVSDAEIAGAAAAKAALESQTAGTTPLPPPLTSDDLQALHGEITGAAKTEVPAKEVAAPTPPPEPTGFQHGDEVVVDGEDGRVLGHDSVGNVRVQTPAGLRVVPPETVKYAEGTGPQAIAAVIAKSQVMTGPPKGAMGAAAGGEFPTELKAPGPMKWDTPDFTNTSDAPPTMPLGTTLGSMPGMVGSNPLSAYRLMANLFLKNPLRRKDGTNPASASEVAEHMTRAEISKAVRGFDRVYREYVKSGGTMSRREFMEEAGKAHLREGTPEATTDPYLRKAVKIAGESRKRPWERNNEVGTPGMTGIPHDPRIASHLWLQDRIDEWGSKAGPDGSNRGSAELRQLLAEAILKGDPVTGGWKLRAVTAESMARAIIKNGGKRTTSEVQRGMAWGDPDVLADYMRAAAEAGADIEDQIREVQARMFTGGEKGVPARARGRIPLDPNHHIDTPDGPLYVRDFLDTNIERATVKYIRQLNGAAAFHAAVRRISTPDHVIKTPDEALNYLRAQARDFGYKEDRFQSDLHKLEFGMKHTLGIPTHEFNAGIRAGRSLKNLLFFRYMSGVATGLKHLAEVGDPIAEGGYHAAIKHFFPAVVDYVNSFREGKPTSRMLQEAEAVAMAVEMDNDRPVLREVNEGGEAWRGKLNRTAAVAEYGTERLAQSATRFSLISYIRRFTQAFASRIWSQNWLDMARGGRPWSAKRLQGFDINEAMMKRIIAMMRDPTNVKTSTGITGVRVDETNPQNWSDVEAAMAYRNGLFRFVNRNIHTMNPTELPLWMSKPGGALVMQLRKFHAASFGEKVGYEFGMRDWIALKKLVHAVAVAGPIVYTARIYMNSLGRADAAEYRRKNLTLKKIILNSIAGSSMTSLLPSAIDGAAKIIGVPTLFDESRSINAPMGPLAGIPGVDWFKHAHDAVLDGQAWAWGKHEPDQKDVEDLSDGLFVPQIFGVRQMIHYLTQGMPRYSKDRHRRDWSVPR